MVVAVVRMFGLKQEDVQKQQALMEEVVQLMDKASTGGRATRFQDSDLDVRNWYTP